MSMEKFTVTPGQRVLPIEGDSSIALVYDGIPDVVTLPPNLGGQTVPVLHGVWDFCPCQKGHDTMILVLDEPTGIKVAECPQTKSFLWFRAKAK